MLLSRTARRVPHRPASTSVASLSTLPLSRSNLPQIFTHSRGYALSVTPSKSIKGMSLPRHFQGKKAFQYNWYTKILESSTTSPLIFLYHNDFTAQKLIKLRRDISAASNRSKPSLSSPSPAGVPAEPVAEPLLTVIRSSIFGAAIRDFPSVDNADVMRMTDGVTGALAVLSLPVLDPPQLKPSFAHSTATFLRENQKRRRSCKKSCRRRTRTLRTQVVGSNVHGQVLGALLDGQILLPERVRNVADLPTLQTLREQLVGLLSSPGAQLAMVLSEAGGGRLARTLEGLKKGLEETSGEVSGDVPPP
ncbi:hypothetical protein C8F04DRAFT_1131736 [Mycena alexandri]|uniref:50S ribosomal protein L10 n=1 Tax=Mycena alexandri TaxID=1745969 RepID=A0AAD6SCD2_9AGAR|nr:hypothetical protein C8F04DRAFT_1131736 [Mycena alexandri]